jgi:hypothetical protein
VSDSVVLFDQADLGRIEIPRERIVSMEIDANGVADGAKVARAIPPGDTAQETEDPNEVIAPFEPQFTRLSALGRRLSEKGWSASADLSYNSSSGNTDENSWRVGLNVRRQVERTRLTNDFEYYRKASEGETTDQRASYGIAQDWLNPESRWFRFVQGRYDYDEFESWRQRAAGQGGVGYHLLRRRTLMLDLRPGLGLRKEWGSLNDDVRFEGLLGADLEWKVSGKQTLRLSSALYPVLTDLDDYRSRTSWNWRYALRKEGMSISYLIGVLHEYQSVVDPGKEHVDLRFYLGFEFGF